MTGVTLHTGLYPQTLPLAAVHVEASIATERREGIFDCPLVDASVAVSVVVPIAAGI